VKFLIDECLTVQLVTVAGQAGYEAYHVAHVGKAGWKDWNVMQHARDQDFILVTNNAADFRKLYAAQPLHAGLVIVSPNVSGEMQHRLFMAALGELAHHGEPVNQVLEIDLDGEEAIVGFYELPSPAEGKLS
jgi:predicted nuclease of predicted toxin-antitoxin system